MVEGASQLGHDLGTRERGQAQVLMSVVGNEASIRFGRRRLIPELSNISNMVQFDPRNRSTYHAGILKVQRRFNNGLQFLSSYTWSKSLDYGTGELVVANSGEHDLAFCDPAERPTLRQNDWFVGDPVVGACACFGAPAGLG